jgi:hypothetical protein
VKVGKGGTLESYHGVNKVLHFHTAEKVSGNKTNGTRTVMMARSTSIIAPVDDCRGVEGGGGGEVRTDVQNERGKGDGGGVRGEGGGVRKRRT